MKKILLLIMTILVTAGFLSAGDRYYTSPFRWYSPEVQGQGGSYFANAQGFNALLYNPAAFYKTVEKQKRNGDIKQNGEITILSMSSSYSGNIFQFMEEYRADPDNLVGIILDQVTDSGLGVGMQVGSGYVGKGFGIGLMSVIDADLPPVETTLGLTADFAWTSGIVAGYAHPFNVGPVKLVAGVDIRPMYRYLIPGVNVSSFLGEDDGTDSESSDGLDLTGIDAMAGLGVGVDAAADVYWKDFIFSLVLRDIGNTRFFFKPLNTLGSTEFSDTDEVEDTYITPWTLNLGTSYHPVFGKLNRFMDFKVHGAWSQPLIFEETLYGYNAQSFWTKLDLGAEVVFLSSVALRTGFQGGYFTAGFGLDLFFVELNGALYAEELGSNAGVQPKMGGALEMAFRF